jgi:hypothetical protein
MEHFLDLRRLAFSFALAVVFFAALDVAVFVLPAPERAAYNWSHNTGGLIFFTAVLFGFLGVPLWGLLHVGLSLAALSRARKGGGRPSDQP